MNFAPAQLRSAWPLLLVLAPLLLLPLGRSSEAPLVIMAIIGIVLALRGRLDWRDPALRLGLALFACYWLPAALSAVTAVAPQKSWSTVASILRFAPFVLFTAWALRDRRAWPGLTGAAAAIILLWVLDAWVQAGTGFSIGGPPERERISGIFGAGNLKLGPALAVLSPFLLLAARERHGRVALALAMLLLAVPILLAGSRAAWLAYAIVLLACTWREAGGWRRFLPSLTALALAALALLAVAWHGSMRVDARIERSLLALQGSQAALDEAGAGRLRIWRTAEAMIVAHPLTGVGVRGFRHAYPHYAGAGDAFVDRATNTGAAHAHQIVLEILSETGVVGLLGWLLGTSLVLRAWWRADGAARDRARAPALALLAMCFPLNTHLAFYSAWWGLLFWWLIALYCAAIAGAQAGSGRRDG